MAKKPPIKTLRNKADKLWSILIRTRDGACRRCGSTEYLQAAHIISRRYKALRWDERNGLALCRGCHHWNHMQPIEFDWWVQDLIGRDLYDSLKTEARNYTGELKRVDLESVVDMLMGRLEELDAA